MANFIITDPNTNFITSGSGPEFVEKLAGLSTFIKEQLPGFMKEDYPKFVAFIQAYYEWMEQKNQVLFESKKVLINQDIDTTIDEFIEFFRKEFLVDIPKNILADERNLIKNIKQFYRARGTEKSFELLFRILYNKEVEFYYPREDVFKSSDGKWVQEKSIKVRVISGNPFDLISREIKGDETKATAIVENVVRYANSTYDVYELFISPQSLFGTFIPDETITVDIDEDTQVVCKIYPVVTGINIKKDLIQRNMWKYTEPLSATGYSVSTGVTFQPVSALPFVGGEAVFGDNTANRDLRQDFIGLQTIGLKYVFSFFIKMDDGSKPNQGTGNYRDFTLVVNNSDVQNYTNVFLDDLGNGVYRVWYKYTHTGASQSLFVRKYLGVNTNKGFKISGFQLEQADNISAYQYIPTTTFTPSTLGGLGYTVDTEVFFRDEAGGGGKARIGSVSPTGAVTNVEILNSGVGYSSATDIEFPIEVSQAYAEPEIGAVFMYPGYYLNEDGQLSTTKFLHDSYFYQQFSYVLLLDESINQYRELIKKILHPCGLIMFGGVQFIDIKERDLQIVCEDCGGSITTIMYNFYANAEKDLNDIFVFTSERKNLLDYTEQFENAYYTKSRCNITADAVESPLGVKNADKWVQDAATGDHDLRRLMSFTAGLKYGFSVHFKKAELAFAQISTFGSGAGLKGAVVDLNTGAWQNMTGGYGAFDSVSVETLVNGWYRLKVVFTGLVSTTSTLSFGGAQSLSGTPNWVGDNTNGIYVWGAQLEQKTVVTSYQPIVDTTFTPVTTSINKKLYSRIITPQKDVNSFGFGPSLRSIEREKRNYLPSPIKYPTANAEVLAPNTNYHLTYGNMQIKDLFKFKLSDIFNNQKKKIDYHPDPYVKFENSDALLLGYSSLAKSGDFNFDASRTPSNFEFSDIRGMFLWFDGSDPTTLFDATVAGNLVQPDGKIARWEDKSGNGYHATQATLANRPTRKINVRNGLGSPLFNPGGYTAASGGNYMSIGTTPGKPSECTMFTVAHRTTGAACATFCFSSGSNTQWGLQRHGTGADSSTRNTIRGSASDGTNATTTDSDNLSNLDEYIIISCRYTNGSNYVELFANGVLKTLTKLEYAAVVTSGTVAEGSIGRVGFFDSGYFPGYISECVTYNRALSNTEMQWVHAKLSQKWNIGSIAYPGTSIDVYPYSPKDLTGVTAWYDFGDAQTIFNANVGGTQSIGGEKVGRVLDKSGNANNLTQSNSTYRPVRVIEPLNGKRNIWINSEPLDGTGYSVSENMTYQASTVIGASRGEAVFGDATLNRRIQQNNSPINGRPYIISFKIKMDDNSVPNSGAGTYKDFTMLINNSDFNTGFVYTHLGNNVYQCYIAFTQNAFPNIAIRKYAGLNSNTGFKISEIQLELNEGINGVPTPYQKVITANETTEVGQKHREGIIFSSGSSHHLIGDGVAPVGQGDDVPFSIICVEKPMAFNNKTLYSFGASAGADYYHQIYHDVTNYKGSGRRDNATTVNSLGINPTLQSTTQITTFIFQGTTCSLYTNGIEETVTTPHNVTTMSTNINQFTVGALRRNTVTNYYDGVMYEMIVLNKAITEQERLFLEAYLAKKWNIGDSTFPDANDILPTDIPDLLSWHDGLDEGSFFNAVSGGSVVTTNGDISRWEDKSGNGYHATNANGTQLPMRFVEPISGRRNLLGITYRLSDAAWGQNGTVTVTNNAILDPEDTVTATRINATADGGAGVFGGSAFDIPITITLIGQAYTASAYLKPNAGTGIVRIGMGSTAFAGGERYVDFNITTGAISYTGANASNATITLDRNGYYRCSFSATATATGAGSMYIYSSGGACDWYAWGPQFELGTVLTAYQYVSGRHYITERNVKNTYGMYCDGVDEYLELGPISKPANWTMFVLASKDSDASGSKALVCTCNSGGSDSTTWGNLHIHSAELNRLRTEFGDGTNYSITYTTNVNSIPNNDYFLSSVFYGAGQADTEIYIQGTKQAITHSAGTATSTNGTSYKTSFGRLGEFNGWYWKGRIKEVIIYNRKLTDSERQKIEYYIYKKWNLPNTSYTPTTLVPTKLSKVADAYPLRNITPIVTGNTLDENLISSSEDLTHNYIFKNNVTVSNSSSLNYAGASQSLSSVIETTGFKQKYIEFNEIRTIAGETYTFNFYVKTSGSRDFIRVSIGNLYTDLNITTKQEVSYGLYGSYPDLPVIGSWRPVRVTYTAPSNGNKTLRISLIEPKRNLVKYTELFSNAAWLVLGSTVGANLVTSPDGTDNANILFETATTGQHYIYQQTIPVVSGQQYTFSVYAKKRDKNFIQLTMSGGFATWHVNANIDTGSIPTSSGVISSSLDTLPNGWYRINATVQATSTTNTTLVISNIAAGADDRIPTYAGNAAQGSYIYGASVVPVAYPKYQEITAGTDLNVDSFKGDGTSGIILDKLHFRRNGTKSDYVKTTGNQYLSGFRNKSVGYFTGKHQLETFQPVSKYITNTTSTSYLVFEPYELTGTLVADANNKYRIYISGSNVIVALDTGNTYSISNVITVGRKHILSIKQTSSSLTVAINGLADVVIPLRTNLQTYSQDFADASWVIQQGTLTSNTILAPDGTMTGDLYVENAVSSGHYVYSNNVNAFVNGVPARFSIYVQRYWAGGATSRYVQFSTQSGGPFPTAAYMTVDFDNITNGSVIAQSGGPISAMTVTQDLNGWYRLSFIGTPAASGNTGLAIAWTNNGPSGGPSPSHAGSTSRGTYIWGAQTTADVTDPIEYVATTGTTINNKLTNITGKTIIGSGFIGKIGRFVTLKTIPTQAEERKVFEYLISIFGI